MKSALPIAIIAVIVLFGSGIGLLAGSRRKMDLEQWTVGGRGFGLILIWLLMAGEVYTTFAFLGASGWAYSRGAPALYILAYITLGYVVSFLSCHPSGRWAANFRSKRSLISSKLATKVRRSPRWSPSRG